MTTSKLLDNAKARGLRFELVGANHQVVVSGPKVALRELDIELERHSGDIAALLEEFDDRSEIVRAAEAILSVGRSKTVTRFP